jgi:hypothetical protein
MGIRLFAVSSLLGSLALAGCGGYEKSGGRWVFVTVDEGRGRLEHPLEGSDPATFEVVARGAYARDAKHVYHRMTRIPDADPRSFTVLHAALWAKDRSHVWMDDMPVRGADPATFRPLEYPYSRDAAHIFCGTVPMSVADPARFEILSGSRTRHFYYSSEGLTQEGLPSVPGVDQKHPVMFGDGWARDGKFHYFGPARVPSDDYASFRVLSRTYARDRTHAFAGHLVVPGADLETFVVDDPFAKDKAHHYAGAIVIEAMKRP